MRYEVVVIKMLFTTPKKHRWSMLYVILFPGSLIFYMVKYGDGITFGIMVFSTVFIIGIIYIIWALAIRKDFLLTEGGIEFIHKSNMKTFIKWLEIEKVLLPYFNGTVDRFAYLITKHKKFRIDTCIYTKEGLKYPDFVAILKKHVPPEKIVENWNGGWF